LGARASKKHTEQVLAQAGAQEPEQLEDQSS